MTWMTAISEAKIGQSRKSFSVFLLIVRNRISLLSKAVEIWFVWDLVFFYLFFFFLNMMEFFSAWWAIWGVTYVDFDQLGQLHENYVAFWKKNGEFRLDPWGILEMKVNIYLKFDIQEAEVVYITKKCTSFTEDWRVGWSFLDFMTCRTGLRYVFRKYTFYFPRENVSCTTEYIQKGRNYSAEQVQHWEQSGSERKSLGYCRFS